MHCMLFSPCRLTAKRKHSHEVQHANSIGNENKPKWKQKNKSNIKCEREWACLLAAVCIRGMGYGPWFCTRCAMCMYSILILTSVWNWNEGKSENVHVWLWMWMLCRIFYFRLTFVPGKIKQFKMQTWRSSSSVTFPKWYKREGLSNTENPLNDTLMMNYCSCVAEPDGTILEPHCLTRCLYFHFACEFNANLMHHRNALTCKTLWNGKLCSWNTQM